MDLDEKFIQNTRESACELLYVTHAVKVDVKKGFKLKSGVMSPIWFSVGVLESDFAARSSTVSALQVMLTGNHEFDAVAGVVSGGVSWASCIANSRALPLLRVHSEKKEFGLHNQIEGKLPEDGTRVLVVDNVITSGSNALKVVEVLRKGEKTTVDGEESVAEDDKCIKRAEVMGFLTIFDWDFPAVNEKFISLGVKKFSLVKFQEVLDYGFAHGYLSEDVRPAIDAFCKQYR